VVTSTLVFEGEGRVREYIGGYTDWLRQRRHAAPLPPPLSTPRTQAAAPAEPVPLAASRKPSYREQRDLEELPARITAMEREQEQLNAAAAAPDFYKETAEVIHQTLARLGALEQEILDAYARWDELDSRAGR
jgi:ATP-binding cassette subfamily F protein uup